MGTTSVIISSIICVLSIIATISLLVFSYVRENKWKKKLKEIEELLEKNEAMKNEAMKKNGRFIGLRYDTKDKEIIEIMEAAHEVIARLQSEGCELIKKNDGDYTELEKELKTLIPDKISCAKTKEEKIPIMISWLFEGVDMSKNSKEKITKMLEKVVDAGCNNGYLDVKKFQVLVKNVVGALCEK
jgi:hypothetical protein